MKKSGFTLVELSIVLVIIGLLIGGILKGKAMIESAKTKKVKTDIDNIVASVYSYQDKFNAIPGDDKKDRSISLGAGGCDGTQGDGNGLIDTAPEAACAWQELIGAGFISGDANATTEADSAKRSPFGGIYSFKGDTGRNYIQMNAPSDIIQSLDEKYDDGKYNKGDIQASEDYPATPADINASWYVF